MNNHGMSNALIYAVSKIRVIFDNGNPAECMENNGTGFFILREDKEYFITNRHVLDPEKTEGIAGKGYKMQTIYIDLRNYDEATKTPLSEELFVKSCNYKFADNNFDDIACISDIVYDKKPTVIRTNIDIKLLATADLFQSSFTICDTLAFIGFPSNQYDLLHNLPIVRSGIISSDPRVNFAINGTDKGNAIAYEVFSTGGSSGSPVFALQKGFKLGPGLEGPDDFFRPLKLIGINAGHTKDPKTGTHSQLSYFYRSDMILALIEKVASGQP